MVEPRWTLDELAERVDAALAVDYHGQPSGRVRDVPDRRAIRWYTTIGLIDRPVAHQGRTALYGPRHLLQLVAVKRLQAKGLPLVAIQQELAGATDTELARVARLPAVDGVARAAGAEAAATVPARPGAAPGAAARRLAAGPARQAGFWRDPPVGALTAESAWPTGPEAPILPAGVAALRAIRLAGGATLLLEPGRDLDAADVQAVLDAARPLLAVLRDRRLAGEPRREHP
jgi:DNA-binding transcriptional MerR regulator